MVSARVLIDSTQVVAEPPRESLAPAVSGLGASDNVNLYICGCYNDKNDITCIYMVFELSSKPEILQALGTRLREHRLVQNLSQSRLAEMAGLSLGALRNLETDGRCSLETLVAVVQALGLAGELEDLFVPGRQSIAQMERAEDAGKRQRASKRKS